MSQAFNIAMVLKADVASAKSALKDVTTGLREVSAEAERTKSSTAKEAAELERLAAAAVKASRSADEHAAAEKRRQAAQFAAVHGPVASPASASTGVAVWRAAETSIVALQARVQSLTTSIGNQGHAAVEAAQGARAWQSALDDIRASYNPLFAASRQYEQTLERIAEHEKMGAITAREAAAARARAAAQLAPVAPVGPRPAAGTGNAWITGNLASQGNDILMMAMAGQNPLQLALQQGTQVSQVLNGLDKGTSITKALAAGFMSMLNPISLATIGIIAFGSAAIQALSGLLPKTKTTEQVMGEMAEAMGRVKDSSAAARMSLQDLSAQFGSASGAARAMLTTLAEVDQKLAAQRVASAVKNIASEMGGGWDRYGYSAGSAAYLKSMFDEGSLWGDLMPNRADAPKTYDVLDAIEKAKGAFKTDDIDAQISAIQQLQDAAVAAADAIGGVNDQEAGWIAKISEAGKALVELKGIRENSKGQEAAAAMARDLERQSVLQLMTLKYGKDSAQVRAEEAHQQQELTAEKLRGLGIDQNSVTWQQIMAGLQADAAARERGILDERARAHEDRMTGLSLERQLIGATTAERLRARAVAEAERTIRDQSLKGAEAELAITRAIAAAAAEAANERARAIRDLQTTIRTDALDAQIGAARDPVTRAALEGQREYIRLIGQGADADIAAATAAAARARSLNDAIGEARDQVATISEEVSIRQQVAAQVAAGTLAAGEANAAIQRELQLRPLIAAAARAEGDEKRRLTEIVTGLRLAHELQAAEERRQTQNDYLRGAAERVQQARLELALIGQSATVRARVLALVQAERDIRAQGLTGQYAAETRRQALELADLNRQIEAQGDAWARVQSAGESAIDAVLDKMKGGDIKGALAGMLDELNKGFFDLAVRNPLKNMLLGTNLGTLDDIGGLRGIWDRLTGRAPLDQAAVIGAATRPVQAMQIAAAQVTINAATLGLGGNAAGLLAGLPGGASGVANVNAAPFSGDVLSVLSGAAVGGGARPGAIAGLDAALAQPLAAMVAEAQRLFGDSAVKISSAYRSVERQQQLWDAALQKYGSPAAARKWVAPPGRSNHNFGLAADLQYGSPDVQRWMHQNAAAYGLTYRMANEPWHIEPLGGRSAARGRVGQDTAAAQQSIVALGASAQAAATPLGQVGQTAQTATGQLGEFGAGMEGFGGALQQIIGAAVSGNKGGAIGGLLNLGLGLLTRGIPGFASGGPTGGSDPSRVAGLVHEGEFVFSAPTVQRIGLRNLDALHRGSLKGFARGGYVGAAPTLGDGGRAAGGNVTFAPSFDLRGANDPAEVERAARRGMDAALEDYDQKRLPGRLREVMADRRVV